MRNQQVLYIANDWVRDNKTSAHHIAEVLARDNHLLYVEGAGMRKPRVAKRDFLKILRKVMASCKRPQKRDHGIFFYSPILLPFHRSAVFQKLNGILLEAMLRYACRAVGFSSPIVWVYMPHYAPVVTRLPRKGIVYYCVDEYSAQPNVDAVAITRMERQLVTNAQVVFTVSEALYETKRAWNANTYLSPHGVDVEHFRSAVDERTPIPSDVSVIRRPIAGFFGLIEEWIDLDLIAFLARSIPGVSFVLIGRAVVDTSDLRKLPNVHLLGQKPYGTLPNYLKAFDVCLLPYKLNAQVKNSNPKKLREYLAGGKPVVSVPNGEVEKYREFVYLAANYDEFRKCIEAALREDSKGAIERRLQAMSVESWERKVGSICEIVDELIVRPQQTRG